ncbi:helix-turn-helix domain-containing protein [Aeromonas veronii]|uniref:helix-turn-helix domain-containing protein n=1 Tax=Aeromonas veronii TaxID=654 RepID=UPI00191FC897|nr:helix-turn-helix domain-containing protein [Aeromonas veronii]MBL0506244.1 helix-turn-helix domain-containing protein [Aeromonas veronii]HDX8349219.1 helix-turn-helix domain-containing protein [Aeromonas veronii]
MYKLIKERVIVDSVGIVVNKYECESCNTRFFAVSTSVVCNCLKRKVVKPANKKYYAVVHEKKDYVFCVVREKNPTAKNIKTRFRVVCGTLPDQSSQYSIQLIATSASDPRLQEWMERVEKTPHTQGRRLTQEQRDKIKEQALILHSQNISLRDIAKILGVDRETIKRIIAL